VLRGVIENNQFQATWNAAGWPHEAREVHEIHTQGWPVN